ncbi:hypothetical protein CBFG_04808 [Clostridiales bacterium 1_7_47FAA]|nr:hypothetical protein CBFG_04808 [Clostridiales bacterium 1_7_47FAA]
MNGTNSDIFTVYFAEKRFGLEKISICKAELRWTAMVYCPFYSVFHIYPVF